MDEFVKIKLIEWNLSHLIPTFEVSGMGCAQYEMLLPCASLALLALPVVTNVKYENEIDEEAFRCLTIEVITTLIPKVGPRMKFCKYHEAERNLSLSSISMDSNLLKDIEFENLQNSPIELDIPIVVASSASSELTKVLTQVDKQKGSTTASGSNTGILTSTEIYAAANLKVVNIKTILERSPEGKAVLHASAQGNERLSNKTQLLLAGAVISEEINNSKDYLISSQRLTQLAESIKVAFPKEHVASYYVPFKLNKVTNTRVLARGKLYDKYCKYRGLLRRNGAIATKSNPKTGIQLPERPVVLAFRQNFEQTEEDKREELQEQLQWLQNCIQPWPTVEDFWKATSKFRVNQLICSEEVSSVEYLSIYKALSQPLGFNLVTIDFTCIYPDKALQLYAKWPDFVDEILHHCRTSTNTNKQIKKFVAEIDDEYVNNVLTDSTALMVLRLIPLLLPCPSIRIPKKLHWRPSKIESQNGFFLHVSSASHFETELTNRKNKLAVYGLTEQPLPVAVGASITSIDSWYVCINHLRYKVHSPIEAVDIAFKSFYALQLRYPKEAETSWMVLQSRIYEISGELDSIVPSVVNLLANLKRST